MGLWTVAGSWSSQQLTEGFVPEWFVATWPNGKKLARALVEAGLWNEADGPEPGWTFHDWTDANPTAEKEKERRRKARERQRRLREKSAAKREEALDKALEEQLSRGTSRVTNSVSHGAPTRPDPSRSSPPTEVTNYGTTSEGGVTEVDAREGDPPLFPDHCTRHQNTYDPPNCGQCADARKTRLRLASVGPHNPATKPHCGACDEARLLSTRFGTIPCPDCNPAAERSA